MSLTPSGRENASHVVESLHLLLRDKVEANERTLLEGVAEYFMLLGRTAEGLACLQEAKNLHRKKFDFKGDARVLRKLGSLHAQRGERPEAMRCFQQSIHASRDVEDRPGEADALDAMATMLLAEERFAEAIKAYEDTLALKDADGDPVGQARTLMRLGSAYGSQGRAQDSLRSYRQALRIWKAENDRVQECECLIEILRTYMALGRFADLINTAAEVLQLLDVLALKTPRAPILLQVGLAWRTMGEWEHAISALTHALDAARKEKVRGRLISAYLALGRALRDSGRPADALKILQQAEGDAKEGEARPMVGEVLLERGMALLAAAQVADAHKMLVEAARLLSSTGCDDKAAEAWLYAAGAAIQLSGPADAEACLVKAHGAAQSSGDAHQLAVIYSFRGSALWMLGRSDEATRWLKAGMDLVDDPAGISRVSEETLLGSLVKPFEGLVDLSLVARDGAAALVAAQRAHAYTCVRLSERLMLPDKTANGTGAVGHCERVLAHVRGCNARVEEAHDPAVRKAMREHIQTLRSELQKHQETAESHHPEYAPLRFVHTIAPADLQKVLEPKTAVLGWLVGERRSYAWLVSQHDVTPFVISAGRAELARLSRNLLQALQERANLDHVAAQSRALSQVLLGEMWEVLGTFERLLVIPDNALFNVPFSVLSGPDGSICCQRWDLAMAPSLPLWRLCQQRGRHAGRARGNPRALAGAAPDAKLRTRGLLGGAGPPPGGQAPLASPTEDMEAGEAPLQVTEIAAHHGLADFDVLVRKAVLLHLSAPLRLTPTSTFSNVIQLGDGGISLHEVARHNFTSMLALLSSTQIQMDASNHTEWVSMLLPLMYAGLPSVVFSRWPVADPARRLFADALFASLQRGHPKALALRHAQMELMGHAQFSHPHFWSGYELAGDWS